MLTREQVAKRAALELRGYRYVDLGAGIPTLLVNYLPAGQSIMVHSENGVLGAGPYPYELEEDADLINAGKETITLMPGASTFDSSVSFAMIRGGHIQCAVLGAYQVSEAGDLANWTIPGKALTGMGGAMDLVTAVDHIIVVMDHTTKSGEAKILCRCTFPLTGSQVVNRIITDMAVIDVTSEGLILLERAADVSVEDIRRRTEPTLLISPSLKTISY